MAEVIHSKKISQSVRDKIAPKKRKEMPSSWFLLPSEKKYPYKVDGKISCALLRAAITRAAQNGEVGVLSEAKRLYEEYCKKEEGQK